MAGYLGLFDPAQSDPRQAATNARRQQELRLAQMNPDERMAASRLMAAGNQGEAYSQLGRSVLGGITGTDQRDPQQKLEDVKRKVQAALQGTDITDPTKVYPILIKALQEAGLVAPAMAAVKEFEEITNKRRDDTRAQKKDDAAAVNATARTEILSRGTPLAQNIEALGNLYKARDAAPTDSALRASIEHRIRIMEDAMAKRNIQIEDAGDKLDVYIDGKFVSSRPKGVDPSEVAKATAKAKEGGEKISGDIADKLGIATARLGEYQQLSAGFRPEFAQQSLGSTVAAATGFQDLYQKLTAIAARDPKSAAAAKWWQELASQIMRVRHDIFGATLTAGESYAFDAVRPLIGLPANVVAQRLKSMRDEAHRELRARVRAQAARGGNVTEFEKNIDALGIGGDGAPEAPAPAGRTIGPAPGANQPTVSNW